MEIADRIYVLRRTFGPRQIAAILNIDPADVVRTMRNMADAPAEPTSGLNWRGQFESTESYKRNDGVRYRGSAWIALEDIPAPAPTPTDTVVKNAPSSLNGGGPANPVVKGDHEFTFGNTQQNFYVDVVKAGTLTFAAPTIPSRAYIYTADDANVNVSNWDSVTRDVQAGRTYFVFPSPGFGGTGPGVLRITGTAEVKGPDLPWDRMAVGVDA